MAGIHLAIDIANHSYGSVIFVKDKSLVRSSARYEGGSLEIFHIETQYLSIVSVYKSSNEPFVLPPNLDLQGRTHLIIDDFNSYSTNWEYDDDDVAGDEVVSWALSWTHPPLTAPGGGGVPSRPCLCFIRKQQSRHKVNPKTCSEVPVSPGPGGIPSNNKAYSITVSPKHLANQLTS